MPYEYQITIGGEEIYFEVENDPEEMIGWTSDHLDYLDFD